MPRWPTQNAISARSSQRFIRPPPFRRSAAARRQREASSAERCGDVSTALREGRLCLGLRSSCRIPKPFGSPSRSGRCSFPTSMLPLLVLLVATDTSAYWQQQVAYQITASLDEPSGVLTGHARISYVNRSPDTLRDFYVPQYLNAVRPGSRWAAADSAEQRERFQLLKDPDYAFERITSATVMGAARRPDYPYAPDSTIAHWALPRPLVPGDSLAVEIDWQARPSTLPRRQGRQGRRFDFAQWYPKVVVYDRYGWQDHPLYPGGEFYGEFATFDVALDLAQDQVIGATGVPVEGDPGWDHAKADPSLRIEYQRDWYRSPLPAPGCDPGRERVHRPHRPRDGPPVRHGPARQQRVARRVARRRVQRLPGGVVLRDARRPTGVRRARARRTVARPRALERAGLDRERAVSRFPDLPGNGLRQGAAVLRGAALRARRRDDATRTTGIFLSLAPEARGRGCVPPRRRGNIETGSQVAVRRVAARDAARRLSAAARRAAPARRRALAYGGDRRAEGRRPHAGRDRRSRHHLRSRHGP